MAKIAALQMCSTADIEQNVSAIESALQQCQELGCTLLVTPEESLTLGLDEAQKLNMAQMAPHYIERLANLARQYATWLVVGSLPTVCDDTHYYSSCIAFNQDGNEVARYHKIHLFDVRVDQTVAFEESKTVCAGEKAVVFDSPVGRIGLSICFDLRFPYLYQGLTELGAHVLLVPSAFTPQTGKHHWQTLLKARAVENLCYVVAPNQNGNRLSGEGTYGHSCILGPWGEVLALQQSGTQLLTAEIDIQSLNQVRQDFPVLDAKKNVRF